MKRKKKKKHKRREKKARRHTFGRFDVRGVRVTSWKLPGDDD
jgi:hypothetical protein